MESKINTELFPQTFPMMYSEETDTDTENISKIAQYFQNNENVMKEMHEYLKGISIDKIEDPSNQIHDCLQQLEKEFNESNLVKLIKAIRNNNKTYFLNIGRRFFTPKRKQPTTIAFGKKIGGVVDDNTIDDTVGTITFLQKLYCSFAQVCSSSFGLLSPWSYVVCRFGMMSDCIEFGVIKEKDNTIFNALFFNTQHPDTDYDRFANIEDQREFIRYHMRQALNVNRGSSTIQRLLKKYC